VRLRHESATTTADSYLVRESMIGDNAAVIDFLTADRIRWGPVAFSCPICVQAMITR
jgi:hypothetical protein